MHLTGAIVLWQIENRVLLFSDPCGQGNSEDLVARPLPIHAANLARWCRRTGPPAGLPLVGQRAKAPRFGFVRPRHQPKWQTPVLGLRAQAQKRSKPGMRAM